MLKYGISISFLVIMVQLGIILPLIGLSLIAVVIIEGIITLVRTRGKMTVTK